MLLRCSICKGQFEVEPSPHRSTVFCSHCGTPLDIRTGPRQPPPPVRTATSARPATGVRPPDPGTSAAPPPQDPLDPLASLALETQPAVSKIALRRRNRERNSITTAIVVSVVTLLICGAILLVVLFIHSMTAPPPEPTPAPAPKHPPGEMFRNVPSDNP